MSFLPTVASETEAYIQNIKDMEAHIPVGTYIQYSSTQTGHLHVCVWPRLDLFLNTLASWLRVHERVSGRQHLQGTPITRVESHCENCQVTL